MKIPAFLLLLCGLFVITFAQSTESAECPGVCYPKRKDARKECQKLKGCKVTECDSEGITGYSCGAHSLTDDAPSSDEDSLTECPDECLGTRKEARKQCEKLVSVGCKIQKCDESGFSCSMPTPPPTTCPNECQPIRKDLRKQCKKFGFLGCTVQDCERPPTPEDASGVGFTCAKPTPTPTACPNVCRTNRKITRRECRRAKKAGLDCQVGKCEKGGKKAFSCLAPKIPTRCPGICRNKKSKANKDCSKILKFGLDCPVDFCSRGDKAGFSCGEHIISPGDDLIIDGAKVGDTYTFNFQFEAALGSGTPKEDFYLLSDATGSMAGAIEAAKGGFKNIVDWRRNVSEDVAFGVGFYRDEKDSGLDQGFKNLQPITLNADDVQSAIGTLTAAAGGDAPEANLVALYKIATEDSIKWREGSRKIVVYFGDVSGHEPTCYDGLTITRDTVISALNAKKITVVGASFGSGLNSATTSSGCSASGGAPVGQASAITSGTGGEFIASSDQSLLIEAIEEALAVLELEYEVDGTECDGKITTNYTPAFPFSLFPGTSQIVVQTLSINEGICESEGSFNCKIYYSASGATLPAVNVKTSNVKGC